MSTNELDVWLDQAPVVDKGNPEFDVWLDMAPVLDNPSDDSTIAGAGRRRVYIF